MNEPREELLVLWRELAWNCEAQSAALREVARQLARDVLALANVSPTDPLLPMLVSGARERAQKILETVGEARQHAH